MTEIGLPDSTPEYLRSKIGELTASRGYSNALNYIEHRLRDAKHGANSDASKAAVEEMRLLRAELLQKAGRLEDCAGQLRMINDTLLRRSSRRGRLLIKAKVFSQSGKLRHGLGTLDLLGEEFGHYGSGPIYDTYLWRRAFLEGAHGSRERALRFARAHGDSVEQGGFHEANNIIYATALPFLWSSEGPGRSSDTILGNIRRAGRLYLSSDVDFQDRLGNRGKSFCQALLAEALVAWTIRNFHNAYRVGFVASLLLRGWGLTSTSEGVGEIFASGRKDLEPLVAALKIVLDSGPSVDLSEKLSHHSEAHTVADAFGNALEVLNRAEIGPGMLTWMYSEIALMGESGNG